MKVEKLTEKQLAEFNRLQAEAQRAQEQPESKEPASTEVKPPEGNGQNGDQNPPPKPPKADKKSGKKKGA